MEILLFAILNGNLVFFFKYLSLFSFLFEQYLSNLLFWVNLFIVQSNEHHFIFNDFQIKHYLASFISRNILLNIYTVVIFFLLHIFHLYDLSQSFFFSKIIFEICNVNKEKLHAYILNLYYANWVPFSRHAHEVVIMLWAHVSLT